MSHVTVPRRPVGTAVRNISYRSTPSISEVSCEDIGLDTIPSRMAPQGPGFDAIINTKSTAQDEPDSAPLLDETAEKHSAWKQAGTTLAAWWIECLCCFLASVLLLVLCLILKRYNGEPAPWFLDLPLSTVVAILATFSRALLFIPVSEGISQLKWNWFQHSEPRPLKDLYTFDQASRGPLGCFMLIFELKGRFLCFAMLACLLLLSGLGTSFMTQAALVVQPDLVLNTTDWNDYDRYNEGGAQKCVAECTTVNTQLANEGLQALNTDIDTPANTTFVAPPYCPTLDCDWEDFSSLAICASVKDVTGRLKKTYDDHYNVTVSLLDGKLELVEHADKWLLDRMKTFADVSGASLGLKTNDKIKHQESESGGTTWWIDRPTEASWDSSSALRLGLSQLWMIWRTADDPKEYKTANPYRATEILWHYCVNNYHLQVRDGVAYEKIIGNIVQINETTQDESYGIRLFNLTNPWNETMIEAREQANFTTPKDRQGAYLTDIFNSNLEGNWDSGKKPGQGYGMVSEEYTTRYANSLVDQIFGYGARQRRAETDEEIEANIKKLADNVARGMTSFLRSKSEEAENMIGQAYSTQSVVFVRWAWLSCLGAQIGLTVVFLGGVMFQTTRRGIQIAKTSNFSELFAIDATSAPHKGPYTYGETGLGDRFVPNGIGTGVDDGVRGQLVKRGKTWNLELI